MNQSAAQSSRNLFAAPGKVNPVHQHHRADDQSDHRAHSNKGLPVEDVGRQTGLAAPGFEDHEPDEQQVGQADQHQHCDPKKQGQKAGVTSGNILFAEEIHVSALTQEKLTLGAA